MKRPRILRVEGHPEGNLIIDGFSAMCGKITDGIALRFSNGRGGFVVHRADLLALVDYLRKESGR